MNIPYIQRKVGVLVSNELSQLIQTEVSIGRINPGLLNRILIDDISIDDKSGTEMVKISRLSAKYDILPLFKGRISIGSVQLFGFDINLNRPDPESEINCKFISDAFASTDTVRKNTNIDLRINSFLIRRGKFAYDVLSEPETPGKFNSKHIRLYNILGNISLKVFRTDSINAQIRRLSVDEQSGFELRKLNLKILGNQSNMVLEDFAVDLPNTSLSMDTIRVSYDNFGSFNRFITDVEFNFNLLPSYITLQDISPFIPVLSNFKDKINVELDANGTIDQLTASRVRINVEDHLRLRGNVTLQDLSNPRDAFIFGKLSHFSADTQGLEFLIRNFGEENKYVSLFLSRLGDISFDGEISGYFTDVVMYGNFNTELGLIKGDVKFSSDREKGTVSYSGGVKTEEFALGGILDNSKWGNATFNLNVGSTFYKNRYPHVVIKGLIAALNYSDYTYENIVLDGEYKNGGFDGHVGIDDENGSVFLNGRFNPVGKVPNFDFSASVKHVNPHALNMTEKFEDADFSLNLTANFSGGSVGEMVGSVEIDSLLYIAPGKKYFMDRLSISSTHTAARKILSINSSFLKADIQGVYSYRDLYASFGNMAELYLPALFANNKKKVTSHNNFSFDINIYNTEFLSAIFDIPLNIYNLSTVKGYLNDETNRFRVEGYFPRLSYGKTFIESGLLICENPNNELKGVLRWSDHQKGGVVNVSLEAQASNDKLTTQINWGNNAQSTYSGHFKAIANFIHEEENPSLLKTLIEVKPTDVILNDTVWKIHPSTITVDKEKIYIDNFNFTREDQFLHIDGYLSDDIEHSVTLELKDINIGYIFDIFNLGAVSFGGLATGEAHISRAFKMPIMNTDLFIRDFKLNDAPLGDMNIHGEWHNEEEGIHINAQIKENNLSDTNVSGYIFPLRPKSGLDLEINAGNINIGFLEQYTRSVTSELVGRGTGKLRLYGTFSTLNLNGSVYADASLKVNILNTNFLIKDSIRLSPTDISFKNILIRDNEGHTGFIDDGYVRHQYFKNMRYRLNINANNMLVMNTPETSDSPFYGKIYATGNALLSGDADDLSVNAAITTNRNTNFVYSISPTASAASNQFIKFTDRTPVRNYQDSIQLISEFEMAQRGEQDDDAELDVRLNIQIDATPEATIRIIMDPISGDYINARGNGNIRTEYYNKGDVRMFGNFNITHGVYKFSLQEVIRKDFIIKEGSNMAFNGNPLDAVMNVQAIYTVNTVSLNDLIPSEMLTADNIRPNVRVNCVMNLSGALDKPDIRLAIELPNERDEVQALVRNYINTDEDVNMQVLYLLAIGKFYTPDYVNVNQNSNVMSSMLSSTLSGQFNNMLSHIINNNNWNIGTNLSTGDRGWTDVEIEGMLSGQLLNSRLLINGNFGYRDNPYANTNFVGDFEAEWLLNRSGDIRLRAYNKTNDKYYIRTNLTTQGIGILFKKDFDKWNDLFFWKRKKTKIKTEQSKSE